MKSFSIFLFLTLLVCSFADFAIDTKAALTIDQFKCLSNQFLGQNVVFIGRVYDPAGFIDETGIQNMKNADQAGIFVDAYMSPCVTGNCQNNLTAAADQVTAVFTRLNCEFRDVFLWIVIERGNWSTNQAQNQQFVMDLLHTEFNNNNDAGVMTNQIAWTSVVGNSFNNASSLAEYLWYINWNGKPDFSDFTPFGGWNEPYIHQYAGDITTNNCTQGLSINYSYYYDEFFARRNAQMAKRSARLHKFARN